MSERAHHLRQALVTRVVTGAGHSSVEARQAAFDGRPHDPRVDALVARVAEHAWTVSDADVAAPCAAGVTEDEVFELVVCAAVGQATRQIESALAALDEAAPHTEQPS